MQVNLKELDPDHPLRNSPLIDIGAKYKLFDGTVWFDVKPAFGIAKKTFNQLKPCWLNDEWIATKYAEDWQSEERDRTVGQNGNVGYD